MHTEPDCCYPPQGNVTPHIIDASRTSEITAEILSKLLLDLQLPYRVVLFSLIDDSITVLHLFAMSHDRKNFMLAFQKEN